MPNSDSFRILANSILAKQEEFAQLIGPQLQDWLDLQVKQGSLDKQDADRDFVLEDTTEKGLIFRSEDWEETWQYGGHESHSGRTVVVPFDFLDDPAPFHEKIDKLLRDRADRNKEIATTARFNRVKQLEDQLAKAKEEAGLV